MRRVPFVPIAICTVVTAPLSLASPADAAGPGAAVVAAVSQTGVNRTSCGEQLQCA